MQLGRAIPGQADLIVGVVDPAEELHTVAAQPTQLGGVPARARPIPGVPGEMPTVAVREIDEHPELHPVEPQRELTAVSAGGSNAGSVSGSCSFQSACDSSECRIPVSNHDRALPEISPATSRTVTCQRYRVADASGLPE